MLSQTYLRIFLRPATVVRRREEMPPFKRAMAQKSIRDASGDLRGTDGSGMTQMPVSPSFLLQQIEQHGWRLIHLVPDVNLLRTKQTWGVFIVNMVHYKLLELLPIVLHILSHSENSEFPTGTETGHYHESFQNFSWFYRISFETTLAVLVVMKLLKVCRCLPDRLGFNLEKIPLHLFPAR